MSTFGYFKKHFMMTDQEIAAMREIIVACAASRGRTLDALYIDEIETTPRQLHACLIESWANDDRVLIIPSLLHFAGEGDPRRLRAHLEESGFSVLIAQSQQVGRTY